AALVPLGLGVADLLVLAALAQVVALLDAALVLSAADLLVAGLADLLGHLVAALLVAGFLHRTAHRVAALLALLLAELLGHLFADSLIGGMPASFQAVVPNEFVLGAALLLAGRETALGVAARFGATAIAAGAAMRG